MDDSSMEMVREALAKLRGDLEQAKSEAADLKEEVHAAQIRNSELEHQIETIGVEKQKLVQEVNELKDLVDQLQTEKRKFGDNFREELRNILS